MTYQVEYSRNAKDSLKKMEKEDALRIYLWIGKNLVNCEEPRSMGKTLKGKYKGAWLYRIGNYRIIAEIRDSKLIIFVVDVRHKVLLIDVVACIYQSPIANSDYLS